MRISHIQTHYTVHRIALKHQRHSSWIYKKMSSLSHVKAGRSTLWRQHNFVPLLVTVVAPLENPWRRPWFQHKKCSPTKALAVHTSKTIFIKFKIQRQTQYQRTGNLKSVRYYSIIKNLHRSNCTLKIISIQVKFRGQIQGQKTWNRKTFRYCLNPPWPKGVPPLRFFLATVQDALEIESRNLV